jgi:hypothetical protein
VKDELVALLAAGREREAATLYAHVDDSEPEVAGSWTTKDVLAHLTAWRENAIAELDTLRTGSPLPQIAEAGLENEKIYARTHALPAGTVLEGAAQSWERLAAGLDALTEQDLRAPRPRHPEDPVLQLFQNHAYVHLADHLGNWSAERGDEHEAERVAIWARDMALSVPDDDRGRGAAEYNLGCFYARRGRAAQALPLLERGIRLRPELKEWAKTDTDLDPIRENEELIRLLG